MGGNSCKVSDQTWCHGYEARWWFSSRTDALRVSSPNRKLSRTPLIIFQSGRSTPASANNAYLLSLTVRVIHDEHLSLEEIVISSRVMHSQITKNHARHSHWAFKLYTWFRSTSDLYFILHKKHIPDVNITASMHSHAHETSRMTEKKARH